MNWILFIECSTKWKLHCFGTDTDCKGNVDQISTGGDQSFSNSCTTFVSCSFLRILDVDVRFLSLINSVHLCFYLLLYVMWVIKIRAEYKSQYRFLWIERHVQPRKGYNACGFLLYDIILNVLKIDQHI